MSRAALMPLREEFAFNGVIVSDDLEMKAIADHYTPSEIVPHAIRAGVDHFLVCSDPALAIDVYRSILRGLDAGEISEATLLSASRRVERWQRRHAAAARPSLALVGCEEHQALAHRIAAAHA